MYSFNHRTTQIILHGNFSLLLFQEVFYVVLSFPTHNFIGWLILHYVDVLIATFFWLWFHSYQYLFLYYSQLTSIMLPFLSSFHLSKSNMSGVSVTSCAWCFCLFTWREEKVGKMGSVCLLPVRVPAKLNESDFPNQGKWR